MAIPWAAHLLHFHLNKLFKKWFLIWHYCVWQLIWLLFKKNWVIFFQIIWSHWLKVASIINILPQWPTGSKAILDGAGAC
jgi:hypothetical protein